MDIKGTKINLRKLRPEDAQSLYENANDPDVARYTRLPHPYTLKDAKTYIEKVMKEEEGSSLKLGIALKENDQIIGTVSLKEFDKKNKRSELGYWLGKNHWRNGYMTEAVKLIIDYGFKNYDLERIYGVVLEPNVASIKLLENIGFTCEGKLRHATFRNNQWYDDFVYSVLRGEWGKAQLDNVLNAKE